MSLHRNITRPPDLPNYSKLTPLDGVYYQYRACQHPGCPAILKVSASEQITLCDAHKPKDKRFQPSENRGGVRESNLVVIILHDPLEEGGFRPGAAFNMPQLCMMLKSSCLIEGTRLRIKQRCFTVINGGDLWGDDGRIYTPWSDEIHAQKFGPGL